MDAPAEPVIPSYGVGSLADLLPSILAAMGVGDGNDGSPTLSLPTTNRVCILLIDGLGLNQLRAHAVDAPFLTSLVSPGHELTAGFPSTTATSLTSLGTGRAPGQHGLLGLQIWVPELNSTLNCLRWYDATDPVAFQPLTTVFEQAAAAGVAVTRIGPRAFDGTGLTAAALRGGRYAGADYVGQRVAAAGIGLREGSQSLVYVYYGDLDAAGHVAGCGSAAWRHQLAHADLLARQIASVLPEDAVLFITADHGMVDVPMHARTDVAARPLLSDGVRLVTGEPRAVYVHTEAGAQADVLAAWEEEFAKVAWVASRDQAVDEGWFGPVANTHLPRIGDVVVAAREAVAIVDSRTMPPELLGLVGMHGSLTAAEQIVPLLRCGRALG